MNKYLPYFLLGLHKYCGQFPQESDLPDHAQILLEIDDGLWRRAEQLNYGNPRFNAEAVKLRSVFEFLKTGNLTGEQYGFYPLSLSETRIFPSQEKTEFNSLVDGFQSEWHKLKQVKSESFTDTLLFLSKKYFSNAGCSPDFPYICLHDHIKTTAALADCLDRSDGNGILLVGAGLDNIQGFCYDIASSKAAKSLKGRSFFLQMLLDTISKEIIAHPQIEATLGHIVYARGGKLFLLLPNTASVRQALDEIKAELNVGIWERYHLSLFMFLKYEPFSEQEKNLSGVWKKLHAKIRTDKQQKNREMLISQFDRFFKGIEEGFKAGDSTEKKQFCSVTGELITLTGDEKKDKRLFGLQVDTEPTQQTWVQPAVKFQSDLGEALREAEEFILWESKTRNSITNDNPIFTGSGSFLTVPKEENWSLRYAKPFSNDFRPKFKWVLNDLDFLPAAPNGTGYGFAFYGGNKQAVLESVQGNGEARVKFFSELAGLEDDQTRGEGFIRLGVGRMDVDGLSNMAAIAESSFALNASFSARLDLFLSGYINTVRSDRQKEYEDFLNIVFSGGDDMLIVGRWDLTMAFLARLRKDFSRFQGGDFLTMSAGLVLVTPKFPIAKAVEMAGNAEDKAKDHPGKNALCFLDEVISWGNEYDFIVYFSERLKKWLEPDAETGISMSLIFKIYRFYEMQCRKRPDWRWLSAWYFQQAEKGNVRSKAIFYCLKIFVLSGVWVLQESGEEARNFKFDPNRALLLLSLGGRIGDFKSRKEKNLKLKS